MPQFQAEDVQPRPSAVMRSSRAVNPYSYPPKAAGCINRKNPAAAKLRHGLVPKRDVVLPFHAHGREGSGPARWLPKATPSAAGADATRDVRPGAAASGELTRSIRATRREPQLLLPIHAPRQCPAQTEVMRNQMGIAPGTLDRGREIACVRTHDIEKCAHRMSRLTRRVGLVASEKNSPLD